MTNEETLIKAGCKRSGNIIIPPNKKVVPVDVIRLRGWSKERVQQYIKDFK